VSKRTQPQSGLTNGHNVHDILSFKRALRMCDFLTYKTRKTHGGLFTCQVFHEFTNAPIAPKLLGNL
jgi:hypothetical protein